MNNKSILIHRFRLTLGYKLNIRFKTTVDPVYSSLGYSEYPVIVNGFLRTDR